MVQIPFDDEHIKHMRSLPRHRDSALACLHSCLPKDKRETMLELFGRGGFFSHLLKLLFLEADLVALLAMPALPETLGSDVLQL